MFDYDSKTEVLMEIVHAYNYIFYKCKSVRDEMERTTYDSIAMNANLVEWANEFINANAGEDWKERDFWTEIGKFVKGKLQKSLDITIDVAGLDEDKVKDVLPMISYTQDILVVEEKKAGIHGVILFPVFPADLIVNREFLESTPNMLERKISGGFIAMDDKIVIRLIPEGK